MAAPVATGMAAPVEAITEVIKGIAIGIAYGSATIPAAHPKVIPKTPAYAFILLIFSFKLLFLTVLLVDPQTAQIKLCLLNQ